MSLLLPIFLTFTDRSSPKIRVFLEKIYIFGDPRWKGNKMCEFCLTIIYMGYFDYFVYMGGV